MRGKFRSISIYGLLMIAFILVYYEDGLLYIVGFESVFDQDWTFISHLRFLPRACFQDS